MSSVQHKPADNVGVSRRIVALPGDGVGPEVMRAARGVLAIVEERFGLDLSLEEHAIGGAAIDAGGEPLPEETLAACRQADAVLLGAVGGPAWEGLEAGKRPESGLLQLRSGLRLYCNLRPVQTHPRLYGSSPIRGDRLEGVDLILVRELTGGIYFGNKTRTGEMAEDICRYTRREIERITHRACALAAARRGRLTLVDKANVLATSRLWRDLVQEIVGNHYPDLELEVLLVDAAAMHLLSRPAEFDVLLTENLFGDILSDEASMLCGSMGLMPSASLRDDDFGLYEPVHGSAPDLVGKGVANPCGMMLSVAMMLRHSLASEGAACAVEAAVRASWEAGVLSPELAGDGSTTDEIAGFVCRWLASETPPDSVALAAAG